MKRLLLAMALTTTSQAAALASNPFHDPFEQASAGYPGCRAPKRAMLSEADLRREAHQRHERGVSCWLARQCEEGGPYQHDHLINAAAVAAIRADPRFANTSLWVETLRGYVTLHGCVRRRSQLRALAQLLAAQPRVVQVWNQARVRQR